MNVKPTAANTISCQVVDMRVIKLAEENKRAIESLRKLHLELASRVTRQEEKLILSKPSSRERFNQPRGS